MPAMRMAGISFARRSIGLFGNRGATHRIIQKDDEAWRGQGENRIGCLMPLEIAQRLYGRY